MLGKKCIQRGAKQKHRPPLLMLGLHMRCDINQCSWDVGTDEPLTHARYADGSIIDGQKMIKSFLMLERFVEELASVGFISNVKKGKKLTTETLESRGFMDVRGHVVDILR